MSDASFIEPHVFRKRLQAQGVAVSIDTVWRWCQSGKVEARKIAGRWRIRATEVQRTLGSDAEELH